MHCKVRPQGRKSALIVIVERDIDADTKEEAVLLPFRQLTVRKPLEGQFD
jgi:hypothetical protein